VFLLYFYDIVSEMHFSVCSYGRDSAVLKRGCNYISTAALYLLSLLITKSVPVPFHNLKSGLHRKTSSEKRATGDRSECLNAVVRG
jgi:hypothetical protein